MTKHPVDVIIDNNEKSYAYSYISKDRDYGKMVVGISLTGNQYLSRPDGQIKISCQIGSTFDSGDQRERTYAWNYGFDARYGKGSLKELEQAVKIMRKIERHMDKMFEEYGEAVNFADYCQRVLIGANVKTLLSTNCGGWAVGGSLRDTCDIVLVGSSSMNELRNMEKSLVDAFKAY